MYENRYRNTRGTSGQVLTAGASGGSVTWSTPSSSSSVWPTSIDNGSITVETFVGVGTTSAQTALGVGGTATVSGNVIIGGNLAVTGTATVNGGMTVSGTTTVVGLQIGTMGFPDVDGNSGQVLSTDGSGVLSWATDATGTSTTVAARAYSSVTTNVGTSFTQITFGSESYDTGSNFASNAFTAPSTGYYQVNSCVELPVYNYALQVKIVVAGSDYSLGTNFASSNFGQSITSACVSDVVKMTASQALTIYAIADIAQNCSTGSTKTFVSIILLGT